MIKIITQVRVRFAKREDLDRISELWETLMQFHNQLDPEFFSPDLVDKAGYKNSLEAFLDCEHPIFVLEYNFKVEGFAIIEEMLSGLTNFNKIPYCKIGDFVVSEKYRGRGYGKRILKKIKEWAEKKGYRRIDLRVSAKNQSAINFYKKMGLKEEFHTMSVKIP